VRGVFFSSSSNDSLWIFSFARENDKQVCAKERIKVELVLRLLTFLRIARKLKWLEVNKRDKNWVIF